MAEPADLKRLRQEYAEREKRPASSELYSLFNPGNLFILQQRQRAVIKQLQAIGASDLNRRTVLEVGCGSGGVLLEYVGYGVCPTRLHGVDLLPNRLAEAHRRLPHLPVACADGQQLPYPAAAFDIILQYTAFSSILDEQIKANVAGEMLRVLKPGGWIVWYDFWINPTNPQTRGIKPGEIRKLFPGCRYQMKKITLAPPLTRFLVPISWGLAYLLETLKILNTHYLAAIQPLP